MWTVVGKITKQQWQYDQRLVQREKTNEVKLVIMSDYTENIWRFKQCE